MFEKTKNDRDLSRDFRRTFNPKEPAEIVRGDGEDVLSGAARVVTSKNTDVSDMFVRGAYGVLARARREGGFMAILKEKSPSCGSSEIYNGEFSGTLVPGKGVTAALLEKNGIMVFSEKQINDARVFMAGMP